MVIVHSPVFCVCTRNILKEKHFKMRSEPVPEQPRFRIWKIEAQRRQKNFHSQNTHVRAGLNGQCQMTTSTQLVLQH